MGQRTFPSASAITSVGPNAARRTTTSVWEASIPFPGFSFSLTPVAVGGLVVLAAGAALLLFFEGQPGASVAIDVLPPFDADDAT